MLLSLNIITTKETPVVVHVYNGKHDDVCRFDLPGEMTTSLLLFCFFRLQSGSELRLHPGQRGEGGRGEHSEAEAHGGVFPGEEGEAGGGAAAELGEENADGGQEEEERGQRAQTLHGL